MAASGPGKSFRTGLLRQRNACNVTISDCSEVNGLLVAELPNSTHTHTHASALFCGSRQKASERTDLVYSNLQHVHLPTVNVQWDDQQICCSNSKSVNVACILLHYTNTRLTTADCRYKHPSTCGAEVETDNDSDSFDNRSQGHLSALSSFSRLCYFKQIVLMLLTWVLSKVDILINNDAEYLKWFQHRFFAVLIPQN